MRVFITGGTGFVGRALCQELVNRGHHLSCLVRPNSEDRLIRSTHIETVNADLFSPKQLSPHLKETDAVIHLVGIIREIPSKKITFARLHQEATESILAATQQAGVKRYLHMSANGTRKEGLSTYHKTKWLAEEAVRQSTLDWTIFRPSLIYGEYDQFINLIASLVRKLPVIPVMGDGEYSLQPIPVSAVARGFAEALDRPNSIKKTYHCGGADCISYNKLLDLVGEALGKTHVRKLPQPLSLMRPLVTLLQHLPLFPMTADQLQMLLEGNCCDSSEWYNDLGLQPIPFNQGLSFLQPK